MEVEIFRGDISFLLISFCLKGFPEEIGIGEGVTEHPLQLSPAVGIHDGQGGCERGKGGSGWWTIDHFPRGLEGRKEVEMEWNDEDRRVRKEMEGYIHRREWIPRASIRTL